MNQSEFLHCNLTGEVTRTFRPVDRKFDGGLQREFYQNAPTYTLTLKNFGEEVAPQKGLQQRTKFRKVQSA